MAMEKDLIKGTCTPEESGIDSAAVEACLRALDETENEVHGIVMERHGKVFCESYLQPYGNGKVHTNHSLGKSYTCTGFMMACSEGKLSPEERFVDVFEEDFRRLDITPDEKMNRLKMRHLMSMSVGMAGMPEMDERWVENFLRTPIVHEPGSEFLYNSIGSCLLAAAVEKRTGEPIDEYMHRRLFGRIGITRKDLVWRKFNGIAVAEPGTSSTTRANLRLGMLYASYGYADGEQLIDRKLMQEAMTKQIETSDTPGVDDGAMGYGWQLWMCKQPGMVRFDGGQGQLCLIWPEKDMVVAIHQAGRYPNGVQKLLDLVENLMAGAKDEPLKENVAATASLRALENGRRLPEGKALPVPESAGSWSGDYVVTEGSFRPWIEVAPVQEDFYHLFYSPAKAADVMTVGLRVNADAVTMICNGETVLHASLTGRWVAQQTVTVLEDLPDYAATARFENEQTLHISLRWLNGWCCPEITLKKLGGGKISIQTQKDMLADGREPFTRKALAIRVH